jgi:F-type H+-transporting ATPase subunit delta
MADNSTIARPYAKALFDVASEARDLEAWSAALRVAARVVTEDSAREFLGRPELDTAKRAEFLATVCSGLEGAGVLASGSGRNLLELLSENDRLQALPDIAAEFDRLKTRAENKIKVTLVSASEVDTAQAQTVTRALEKTLGRQVDLALEVDPTLLGGAVVRAEDMVIDGSVRSRLRRLAETLVD